MCRFNLLLVKEKEAEEILLCEGYEQVYNDLMGYKAFQKGYCNCGSFVGSMCDKKALGLDYYKIAEDCKTKEIERLYEIRDFMNQPEYREKRQEFDNQKVKILEEMDVYRNPILEYEIEQMEEIENNYSGEDYNQQMEKLYQKLDELNWEVENTPIYQAKKNEYFEFLSNNQLMEDSTCYYLSEEEEEEAKGEGGSLEELFGEDFEISEEDIIEIDEPSSVIYKVIEREENNTFQSEIEEYNSYCEVFNKVLDKTDSFHFATIWSEPNEPKKIKDVDINSLIIDDLAFLEYDEMVCITKETSYEKSSQK